jgi:hypothetical protein
VTVQEVQVVGSNVDRAVTRPRLRDQVAHAFVVAALFAAPVLVCIRTAGMADPDVWWHLRAGEWIQAHHSVPFTDPFSSFGAGKPWAEYSWLCDYLLLGFFRHWGMVGILLFTAVVAMAITVALYHMIQRQQADFMIQVILTCAAWWAMTPLYTPRPWLFTILFYTIELDILLHARRTGKTLELLLLPAIFALWANLHIQFINGLLVLGMAAFEALAVRWWSACETRIRPKWIIPVFVACVLSPMLNPYGWKIYSIARDLATQPGVLDKIMELQALPFRIGAHYMVLAFALVAAYCLGVNRKVKPFEMLLLALAAFLAFRSRRDVWMLVISAAAVISAAIATPEENRRKLPRFGPAIVAVVTAIYLFVGLHFMTPDNKELKNLLAEALPVDAVETVKAKGYSGPLFNTYDWGGFLIWQLRMPVSIDGRAALHGTDRIDRYLSTWNGEPDWIKDPELAKAGVVLGPIKAPLTQLLRMDPRFELAYQDKLAAVFVARAPQARQ